MESRVFVYFCVFDFIQVYDIESMLFLSAN